MQAASDKMDSVVLAMGPGLCVICAIAAAALNYLRERRFLPTFILLALPAMTFGGLVLLFVDKEWSFSGYVTRQPMDDLPADVISNPDFRGIISFEPLPGHGFIVGNRGYLVRQNWKGPINDTEQQHLVGLSSSQRWKKDVNFLCRTAARRRDRNCSRPLL